MRKLVGRRQCLLVTRVTLSTLGLRSCRDRARARCSDSEGKISGSVSVKRRFITGNNRSDFTVGTEDGHSDCTDTTGDMAAAQTRTSCNAGVRRELGGDDDIGSINRTIASPGSGRVTLGGGGAIATGSESYGEVHRCVQIPLWQPRNAISIVYNYTSGFL